METILSTNAIFISLLKFNIEVDLENNYSAVNNQDKLWVLEHHDISFILLT